MEAKLNITWNGQNGDLPSPIMYDSSEEEIREMAAEAVRAGTVPGIRADGNADFRDFMVQKFDATEGRLTPYVMLRPKTPYGS